MQAEIERVEKLGESLRRMRKEFGLTMRQVQELTGITQGYLSQIETGVYVPSHRAIQKLAAIYRVEHLELCRLAGIVGTGQGTEPASEVGARNDHVAANAHGICLLSPDATVPLARELLLPVSYGSIEKACLLVVGDGAMEPCLVDGDWLLITRTGRVKDGQLAVVAVGDSHVVRQCKGEGEAMILEALNAGYEQWTALDIAQGAVRIVGRAVRLIGREI